MVILLEAKRQLQFPGPLDEFGVIGLLKLIETAGETGRLRLYYNKLKVTLWFRRGKLIHVHSWLTEEIFAYLLIHNKFMTRSILKRCRKLFAKEIKQQRRLGFDPASSKGAEAAHFSKFLLTRNLLNRQHREELHRLLTEWQAMSLLAWKQGRWSFDLVDLPSVCDDLPNILPERLLWRYQQILTAPTALLDHYSWERNFELNEGSLCQTPLPILLNAIKGAGLSGRLTLQKLSHGRSALEFIRGEVSNPPLQLIELLTEPVGKFRFTAIPENKLKPPKPLPPNYASTYELVFSDADFQKIIVQRSASYESSRERSSIRETTNFRAWIEVKIENIWLSLKPSFSWFIPLAAPLIIALIYFQYVISSFPNHDLERFDNVSSIYSAANEIFIRLQNRQILPSPGEELKLIEQGIPGTILMKSATKSEAAKQGGNGWVYYQLKLQSPQSRLELEVVDLMPQSANGFLAISEMKAF
jgi:hypothetical protein